MIEQGGVKYDGVKVSNDNLSFHLAPNLKVIHHGDGRGNEIDQNLTLLLQVGKRKFLKILAK